MQAKAFQRTLHHKTFIAIILMIQIRRNRLLTVIKVDVITRDVEAVTELRETLIHPPSVCSQVKQGRYLNNITLKHNVLPLPGKINKRQYHHRKINKPIKQDRSQQKQLDRNQMIFRFQHLSKSALSSEMFG